LPSDPRRPLVCVDERPYQLLGDILPPLPPAPTQPRRIDHEYERRGTCNLFAFFQPLAAWRHFVVTDRRTAVDSAHQMRALVDGHFPEAPLIRVVVDNLNTHSPAALYATFPPAEARRLTQKLEFHSTPKHGSWLNQVEIELAVLARACLDRRLPDQPTLRREVASFEQERNQRRATVTWRFTTDVARTKFERRYPS
jgi:hypothetical protein